MIRSMSLTVLFALHASCAHSSPRESAARDHAPRTETAPARAAVAEAEERASVVTTQVAPGSAVPPGGRVFSAQEDATGPEAPAVSGTETETPTTWTREIHPASLEGLSTTLFAPDQDQASACRGVMSEGQLCTCLTGAIDPAYADNYGELCRHHSLGVPGFAVFTDRGHSTYITAQKEGGWHWLAFVDSAGTASWSATGGRIMQAGKRTVLAIDVVLDAGCGNEQWVTHAVKLCALRELDDPQFGRCVTVPVRSVYTEYDNEGNPPKETRAEASFRLTGRGTVVVRAKGKVDETIAKGLGEHRL